MKKIYLILLLPVLLLSMAAPAGALIYLGQTNSLPNSSPVTEERWLESLLSGYSSDSVNYVMRFESSDYFYPDSKSLIGFDPEMPWSWAVVKIGRGGDLGGWYAYQRQGEESLSVGPYRYGVSHVTFYGVPEPATMLLLGLGLLGLGVITRRRS